MEARLARLVQRHGGVWRADTRRAPGAYFEWLHTKDGVSITDLDRALTLLEEHYAEEYVPAVSNAYMFRQKIDQLLRAADRYERARHPEITEAARLLHFNHCEQFDWPSGCQEASLLACQYAVGSWATFRDRVRQKAQESPQTWWQDLRLAVDDWDRFRWRDWAHEYFRSLASRSHHSPQPAVFVLKHAPRPGNPVWDTFIQQVILGADLRGKYLETGYQELGPDVARPPTSTGTPPAGPQTSAEELG